MRIVVPCIGAKRGSKQVQQCRQCLCVKSIRDLPPELPWKAMQACPAHHRVARKRHAGMPRLVTAVAKQCRILSRGTVEPVFVVEFPVRSAVLCAAP